MIEKNPVKLSEDSQSKWIFSTNPAINLQFFNGKNAEEIFLIKLSKLIQDELSPNGSEDEVVPEVYLYILLIYNLYYELEKLKQ